jgi:hypothetical protein
MLFNLNKQIAKLLQCPDCSIDMLFLGSRPTKRVFASTVLERAFFLCPNCRLLIHRIVSMPQASYDPQSGLDSASPEMSPWKLPAALK